MSVVRARLLHVLLELFILASNKRHREELATVQSALSQAQTATQAIAHHRSTSESRNQPRSIVVQPPQPATQARGDNQDPPLPRRVLVTTRTQTHGSSHTGTHHHKKTASILSKPSVRIDVQE